MAVKQKLAIALAIYAVLALVAWQTLSEQRLRLFVFAILGFFVLKTLLHWRSGEPEKVEALGGRERSESPPPRS